MASSYANIAKKIISDVVHKTCTLEQAMMAQVTPQTSSFLFALWETCVPSVASMAVGCLQWYRSHHVSSRCFSVCHCATVKYQVSCFLFLDFWYTMIFLATLMVEYHAFSVRNFMAFFIFFAMGSLNLLSVPLSYITLQMVCCKERQELNLTGSWTEGFMILLSRHLQGSFLHRPCATYLQPLTKMLNLILKTTQKSNLTGCSMSWGCCLFRLLSMHKGPLTLQPFIFSLQPVRVAWTLWKVQEGVSQVPRVCVLCINLDNGGRLLHSTHPMFSIHFLLHRHPLWIRWFTWNACIRRNWRVQQFIWKLSYISLAISQPRW